jgi:hypothetical protein
MGKPGAALRAAGWVTVGVIAAGGVATAATTTGGGSKPASSTATTTAATPSTAPTGRHLRGKRAGNGALGKLGGRLLHGQATVLGKDGKPVVVAEQRGTVDAVSATSITLTSKDGFKQTYVVDKNTRVRVDGKKSAIADVTTGQTAGVVAKVDGSTQTAVIVIERAPKAGGSGSGSSSLSS